MLIFAFSEEIQSNIAESFYIAGLEKRVFVELKLGMSFLRALNEESFIKPLLINHFSSVINGTRSFLLNSERLFYFALRVFALIFCSDSLSNCVLLRICCEFPRALVVRSIVCIIFNITEGGTAQREAIATVELYSAG